MVFIPAVQPLITHNTGINKTVQTIAGITVYYPNTTMQNTKTTLEEAAKGLLMMSETDSPFEYFTTEATVINDELALKLADKPDGTTVETTTVDYLLRNMTDASVGSVSADDARKFQNLANKLNQELTDIKVYRVGRVQVQVFIIGKTADGNLAGIKTLLIET